ncbi:hypothetical protein GCM10010523_02270 [Paenarthrobacter ilicis]
MCARELPGFQDELNEFPLAVLTDVSVAVEVLHKGQRTLVRSESYRARAGVSVHQKKVDGVGPDIENAKTHSAIIPRTQGSEATWLPRFLPRVSG